jgi:hypothetical protein
MSCCLPIHGLSALVVGPKMDEKKRKYSGNMISKKPEIIRDVDMKQNNMWSSEKVFVFYVASLKSCDGWTCFSTLNPCYTTVLQGSRLFNVCLFSDYGMYFFLHECIIEICVFPHPPNTFCMLCVCIKPLEPTNVNWHISPCFLLLSHRLPCKLQCLYVCERAVLTCDRACV